MLKFVISIASEIPWKKCYKLLFSIIANSKYTDKFVLKSVKCEKLSGLVSKITDDKHPGKVGAFIVCLGGYVEDKLEPSWLAAWGWFLIVQHFGFQEANRAQSFVGAVTGRVSFVSHPVHAIATAVFPFEEFSEYLDEGPADITYPWRLDGSCLTKADNEAFERGEIQWWYPGELDGPVGISRYHAFRTRELSDQQRTELEQEIFGASFSAEDREKKHREAASAAVAKALIAGDVSSVVCRDPDGDLVELTVDLPLKEKFKRAKENRRGTRGWR